MENAREEIKKEFCWCVRTARLIDAALIGEAEKNAPYAAEVLKDNRADKRAEALRLTEDAQKHCEQWIAKRLEREEMTQEEAEEARQGLKEITEEAKRQAEALKD